MRKFYFGLFAGILVTIMVPILFIFLKFGAAPFQLFWMASEMEEQPEGIEQYQGEQIYDRLVYNLTADFMDKENSNVSHNSPLTFFRQEPALELTKQDYDKVCVSEVGADFIVIAFSLIPGAQEKLLAEFQKQDEKFRARVHDRYEQRFILEGAGAPLAWFWMTDTGAQQYSEALAEYTDIVDFSLKVPRDQLYDMQYLLMNDIVDTPLKGCSDEVDLKQLPNWKEMINYAWGYSE